MRGYLVLTTSFVQVTVCDVISGDMTCAINTDCQWKYICMVTEIISLFTMKPHISYWSACCMLLAHCIVTQAGRHARFATGGQKCTLCYKRADMHALLQACRHARFATGGQTCTLCYEHSRLQQTRNEYVNSDTNTFSQTLNWWMHERVWLPRETFASQPITAHVRRWVL